MAETFFDKIYKNKTLHTPDVLSCLANLSNDEVFTPPDIANKMLDLLPQELFKDPNTTFLDPACKTGVFLREIAKRLIVGLQDVFPNLQERLDHIFHKQLYGIAITELTSLLSRRSLYCSKYPNGEYSVSHFDSPEGNIRFRRIKHTWVGGKCKFCGANQKEYDRGDGVETYAYEFIHNLESEKLFNMKFDVIISNPPYQLSVGGGGKGSGTAIPIYHLFVNQAKKLNPRYLTMIIPSRWFSGGRGLDSFRQSMLNDPKLCKIVDFADSKDCFPGVDIAGGVCYFLWQRDNREKSNLCEIVNSYKNQTSSEMRDPSEFPIFIRNNSAVDIIKKVLSFNEKTFNAIVKPVSLYGLNTNISLSNSGEIAVRHSGGIGYCKKSEIRAGQETLDKYKVYISAASFDHAGQPDKEGKRRVLSIIDILEPKTICTSTYIVIQTFNTRQEALNLISYLKTKFVRFLLAQVCISQHISRETFCFVPMQDFSKPWTDEELYKKYKLTKEEIAFIENMIKPME